MNKQEIEHTYALQLEELQKTSLESELALSLLTNIALTIAVIILAFSRGA